VIEVEPGRFRETFGRYFEDFVVGHIYEHRPGEPSPMPTMSGSRF
jgi:itaconyl-CoA hydratase